MLAAAAGAVYELRRDLMMLQQNSYFNSRYINWLRSSGDTTSAWRIAGYVVFLLALGRLSVHMVGLGAMALFGLITSVRLARAKYKKPLVWTARAKRIYAVAALLAVAVVGASLVLFGGVAAESRLYAAAAAMTGCYCGSHLLILAANAILRPVEKRINRRYIDDAVARLRSMPDLKVVGITGSYGKTSTKHFLHRILSEQFDTLMTPGSYNTTLGVVRTVRELLKPYNEVFIVEMGAKRCGDIREICDIVHPPHGHIDCGGSTAP